MIEHGPYVLDNSEKIHVNNYTITKFASVFYLDNPVGTGFSFVDDSRAFRTNEDDVAEDLLTVITTLIGEAFPEYSNSPIFITGESYAGKYIPYVASLILKKKGSWTSKVVAIIF